MNIEVYTKPVCGECVQVKNILKRHNLEYVEVSAVENRQQLIDRVKAATGNEPRSVPQVFIDNQYVGGKQALETYLNTRL